MLGNLRIGFGLLAESAMSVLTPILLLGGAILGLYAGVKFVDALYESFDELKEKATQAKQEYENTKSELENVNKELETTQTRISELEAKNGSLSPLEQAELDKLYTYNEQLEAQKSILEQIVGVQKEVAARSQMELLGKLAFDSDEIEIPEIPETYYDLATNTFTVEGPKSKKIDIVDEAIEDQEKYNKLIEKRNELYKNAPKTIYADANKNKFTEEYKEYQKQLKELDTQIESVGSELLDHRSIIDGIYNDLKEFDDGSIPGIDDALSRIENFYEIAKTPDQKAKDIDKSMQDIVSSTEDNINKYNALVEKAKENRENGGLLLEDLQAEDYADLVKSFTDGIKDGITGEHFTKEDLVVKVNAEAQVLNKEELKNQLDETIQDVIDFSSDNVNDITLKTDKVKEVFDTLLSDEQKALIEYLNENSDWINEWELDDIELNIDNVVHGKEEVEDEVKNLTQLKEQMTSVKETYSDVQSAISSSASAIGLSADDVTKVSEAFKKVEGYDPKRLFEKTANGIHLNRDALKEYNEKLEAQTRNGIWDSIIKKQNELNEAQKNNASNEVISGLQEELFELKLVSAEYDGLTSKFNKYVQATSSANDRDSFESVANGYKAVGKLLEEGWITDDSVTTYLDLLMGPERVNQMRDTQAAYKELSTTIEGTSHSLSDYIKRSFDADGNFQAYGAWDFFDDVQAKLGESFAGYKDGEYYLDLTGDKLQTVAEEFGTTTDFVELLSKALADSGLSHLDMDVESVRNFNKSLIDTSKSAKEAHDELLQFADSQYLKDIDLNYDVSSMSASQIDSKIGELTGKKEALIGVNTDEALTTIQMLEREIKNLNNQKALAQIGVQIDNGESLDELIAIKDDPDKLKATFHIDDDDEISQIQEKLEELSSETIEAPVIVKIDDSQFSQLSQPKESTETLTITANNEDAKEKVQEVISEVENANPEMKISGNAKGAVSSAIAASSSISGMSPSMKIHANTSSLNSEIQNALSGKTFTVNVHAKVNTTGAVGTTKATGTMIAHASGTAYNVYNHVPIGAYARGNNVALDTDQDALVNEEGKNCESIVRNGVWSIIPGGPHVEHLKKGDLIFSKTQTKQLLESGRTNGHARAYASGTVSGMPAYAGLLQTGTRPNENFDSGNDTKVDTGSSKTQQVIKDTANTIKETAKTVSNNSSETAEDTKELTDWIEVRMSRLQTKVDDYLKKAELATGMQGKLNRYGDAQKYVSKMLSDAQKGADRYMKQAESVGLSSDIKKLVQSGEIDIKQYSEETQNLIQDYQNWYEKGIALQSQILDLQQQQKDIEQQRLDSIRKIYETSVEYRKAVQATSQSMIDLYTAQGKVVNSKEAKSELQSQISLEKQNIPKIQREMQVYAKEMKNAKKIFGESSTEYLEAKTAYQEQKKALIESKTAVIDLGKQLRQLDISRIELAINSISDFSKRLSDTVQYKIARKGESSIVASDYTAQIKQNNDLILQWQKLKEEYQRELFENKYQVGSEEYERVRTEIEKANSEIISLATNNEALKDSIINLRFKPFENLQKQIGNTIEEMDYLQQFFKEDSFFDDNGKMTDNALTSILLTGEAMQKQQQTIANYREALNKLEKMKKSGAINQDEYNEKSEEYLGIIRNSVSAVESYKNSLVELYKKQLQEENKVLQENIKNRKDALAAKREYFEFDKKLKNKTKAVQLIEAEIAALENVNNASAKSRLAKLQADLADAQDDLNETLDDHQYDLYNKGYDDLSDNLNEELEKHLKNIDLSSEKQNEIVDSMLAKMESSYKSSFNNINGIIENTGLVMSNMTKAVLKDLETVGQATAESLRQYAQTIPTSNTEVSGMKTNNIEVHRTSDGGVSTEAVEQAVNGRTVKQQQSDYTKKAKATSLSISGAKSIAIGKTLSLGAVVEPSTAVTNLSWSSSKSSIASVDKNGKVIGKAEGTVTITVKDSNSGKSGKCSIFVYDTKPVVSTQKPDDNTSNTNNPKPQASNTGDKKLTASSVKVGDKVKFASGSYYASSDGTGNTGTKGVGGEVYIQKVNTASWATKPYLIGTSKDGGGLGWVSLDQLKGYRKGKMKISNGQWAWTQEDGPELIVSPSRNAMLTQLNAGDGVINADTTKNLMEWGKMNPEIMNQYTRMPGINSPSKYAGNNIGRNAQVINNYEALIKIEGNVDEKVVVDLEEIANKLLNNRNFMNGTANYTTRSIAKDARKNGLKV